MDSLENMNNSSPFFKNFLKKHYFNILSMLFFGISIINIISINKKNPYLFHILITIIFIYLRNHYKIDQHKYSWINQERNSWFALLVIRKLSLLGYHSHQIVYELANTLGIPNYYKFEQEIISINSLSISNLTLPDIGLAEKELIDQDKRIAKLLVLLVFIPILFIISHFFVFITLASISLNIIIMINFLDIITLDIQNSFKLKGWGDFYDNLLESSNLVLTFPFQSLLPFYVYLDDFRRIDLFMDPVIRMGTSLDGIISSIFKIVNKFDPIVSKYVLDEIIYAVKDLPRIEMIHSKKWEAYSAQFIMVTTAVMFFTSIIVAISKLISKITITNGRINSFSPFQINPLLDIFTIILLVWMISILSTSYLSLHQKIFFSIIWIIEFLLIEYIILFVFNSIV